MADHLSALSKEHRALLVKRPQPQWIDPMLATLVHDHFWDPQWIYELKADGQRCLAFKKKKSVRLLSRNRESAASSYPEVVEALQLEQSDMILDGEVVAFKGSAPSFSMLQSRMHVLDPARARATGVEIFYYVFDVLYLDGYDVRAVPLRARKSLLKRALKFGDPLRFMQHRNFKSAEYFDESCARGWEGLIAKRGDAPYTVGRSKDWLKFKCSNQQEFVIGGYTDPQGSREYFGALLVGHYERDELRYAGKVGTGFDRELLRTLHRKLAARERKTPPFAGPAPVRKGVHWVQPSLVAQIAFAEWTNDGRLRHPRFLGLRTDKNAKEVVRERGVTR